MLFPKTKRLEDKKYLRWVASQPCMICKIQGASQAAHIHKDGQKSKGAKVGDNQTCPLCHAGANDCHGKVDRYEIEIDRNKIVNSNMIAYGSWKNGNPETASTIFARF